MVVDYALHWGEYDIHDDVLQMVESERRLYRDGVGNSFFRMMFENGKGSIMTAKKVLCLHGYGMCSDWLREWLTPVEQQLDGRVRFIYPQGPIECPAAEVLVMAERFKAGMPARRIGPGMNWCWYRASDEKPPQYVGMEMAFDYLADVFAQEGDIEGVIGWSQGAVMAALLAGDMLRNPDSKFRFNWVMPCGGFVPGDRRYRTWFDEPLNLPSLHVIGERESEFMLKQGSKLVSAFKNSERLDTPAGHVLPIKYPDYMARIADWIAARLGAL